MPTRRLVVLGAVLLMMLLPPSASAIAEAEGGDASAAAPVRVLTTTEESDCYEVVIPRSAHYDQARALVPSRYAVAQSATGAALLSFVDYRCDSVAVDGHPPARDTTVSIIGIRVTARDGATTGGLYMLAVATNNPVLFAHYRAAGLPVEFQPRTGSSERLNDSGTSAAIEWTFVGDRLNHTIRAVTVEPPPGPITSPSGTFYFDERRGGLRLAFANLLQPSSTAVIFADFSGASAITPLFTLPRLQFINGVSFPFTRGSWRGVLERID